MKTRNETLKYIKDKYGVDVEQPIVRIDIDRFRGFTTLLRELDIRTGAEIGVLKGQYSKWLCAKIRKLKLYLVDPYVAYDEYSEQRTQEDLSSNEAEARIRMEKFNVEFVKKWSMDAVKDFEDESLDFVFIDANHDYKWVKEDIEEWSKKVKKGGIVSGHDYSPYHFKGVVRAVDEWVKKEKISPLFLIGHKVWFYVK